ncbi:MULTISPECIES: urease accessory protein UreH domain-containing protein [Heyndrickxia]|uniref:High-affinity nickel-transporter n=1 Tax=Heyndrickxia coagulans 36D1 TaxID=345219 RepID=G2TLK3_HEYCO|nr:MULTISPECIES: sulfite exporter TauE/SafE family protein [Heyndrickxia]AEP01087.1 high-affinity nickel-transporter [Heyndrickxia coagulans 36D1]AWP38189.1 urease accessory protein UreH [Heyndrickxia coagulans]MEC2304720.1 sulfite exporter TauE/SafE family protein [Weizmannia sp. CD-2023]MEC2340943.1 sulfite exporter TauE/SafE family protein [Weizmannia sp. CD-2023]QDI60502.1 urease accessory protein UreH [Heyndrickxia coagulans]
MDVSFISVLALGFVLGIKHAIEPDHIIAVSTIASRSKKLSQSSLAGVFWGIGHTATLFIVGICLLIIKGEIPEKWAMSLEFLVGIMLVYLGITTLTAFKRARINHHYHIPGHKHPSGNYSYIKSVCIGLVHGLAGSGAMVLLTMSTVKSVVESAVYILIFGIGTIFGMLFFTTILGIPFIISAKRVEVNKTLTQITGAISTVFGIYYMYNLGIGEGLFKMWLQSL